MRVNSVWADASCDAPDWDINDELEKTKEFCQWSNGDEVLPDNYLKSLPGSQSAPELARVLSYNAFNTKARAYKKRNLQAAARLIADFAKNHPDLFVGINLDSDTYMNPFFEGAQWFDYNPDTLRQFRHWLKADGLYAPNFKSLDIPNLSKYRRKNPATLTEISERAGKRINRWDDVDPPRHFPSKGDVFWKSPWFDLWEQFRRHVVDVHYDELSQWVNEAGIPTTKIYSSQGFHPPKEPIDPFAVYLNSPAKNYDSGGMSVEGAVPSHGRLGAVLYGDASRNAIRTETGEDLFSIFNRLSPHGWGVVEFHPGHIHHPELVPSFPNSYDALKRMYEAGAGVVSTMAWNGGSGNFRKEKGYVAFTVIKDTPLESAIKQLLSEYAYLPANAKTWTFGTSATATDDGWTVTEGIGNSEFGQFFVKPSAAGQASIRAQIKSSAIKKHSGNVFVMVDFDIEVPVEIITKLSTDLHNESNQTLQVEKSIRQGTRNILLMKGKISGVIDQKANLTVTLKTIAQRVLINRVTMIGQDQE